MDRTHSTSNRRPHWLATALCLCLLLPSSGCLHQILATGIYLADGGNLVDAPCEDLEEQRVVVFCRPPLSSEYSHAGASRQLAKRVSSLLRDNVKDIDMVDPREVDSWLDENDSDDYEALGQAVGADRVVRIELDHFDLFKGKTLYQGNADVTVKVYDMTDGGREMWDAPMGEMLFPVNSGIPAQDKPVRQFQREFVQVLAGSISRNFYRHDPHADFAIDALANR
ncbi:MAG: hypothetical protein AAGF31_02445 [Planctomycetota bacterium]